MALTIAEINKKKLDMLVAFSKLDPIMDWRNIQVGKTYHIPPIAYSPRQNILITSIGPESLTYLPLNEKFPIKTKMYRTDVAAKFLSVVK